MASNQNSVVAKCHNSKVQKELDTTAAAIIPGYLLERTSTSPRVQAHSTQGGDVAPIMVALEDDLNTNDTKIINQAYAATAGTKIQVWFPQRGDEANMILEDGENISVGDKLESNGNGKLKKYTADVDPAHDSDDADAATTQYGNQIVAVALEAVDLSDSSGAEDSGALDYDARIWVEIV